MSTIEVAVAGRGIQVKQGYEKPSAGDVNTCQVSLAIESGGVWDDLPHKRVTFANRTASVTVDYAPTIAIPHEVMASPGALYLTLTGYDEDGIEVARTHRMTYPIEVARAGADEGAEPSPATLDVVSRIDALAADLEEKRDTDYWRGEPGNDGAPGAPGYSPTANVTKVGGTATITVTDKNGTTTATVSDGAPGAPGKDGSDATATDVRINGTSITVDGVADIPAAVQSSGKYGVVKLAGNSGGIRINGIGELAIVDANHSDIDKRSGGSYPITTNGFDYAVKAAMCDGKGAAWTADEQKAARWRMNAADANKVYIMQKQIENLQGIAATEETDSTEAYTKTVPTGAQKWASLDKVGGKTIVWNQLAPDPATYFAEAGISYTNNGEEHIMTCSTTANNGVYFENANFINGHKYLFAIDVKTTAEYIVSFKPSGGKVVGITEQVVGDSYKKLSNIIAATGDLKNVRVYIYCISWDGNTTTFKNPSIIDLTAMFGAGNEPTTMDDPRIAFIKAYAEEHPEYNAGELMSAEVVEVESKGTFPIPQSVREMCPGYGWSAGSVYNEIDFGRKVYTQRVGSVDLSTLNLSKGNASNIDEGYFGYYLKVSERFPQMKPSANAVCERFFYHPQTIMWEDMPADSFFANKYLCFQAKYDKLEDFKTAMAGVLLYYELAEPIEVDLSDVLPDDHYIEVESGGTVTFKQASTQLPVPSSVTYQISTSEVIANA